MRNFFFIFISVLIVNSLIAQNDTLISDSCSHHKNEFGINLIPAAAPLMIGSGEYYDVAITYKRHDKGNGAYRLRLNYTPDYSFHHVLPFNTSSVLEKNDTISYVLDLSVNSTCYGISVGYEKHREGRWTTDFYGVDANFNLNLIEYSSDTRLFKHDSAVTYKDIEKRHIDYEQTMLYRIGFNVFYGLNIPVANQFSLSIQFGADVGYYFGEFAYTNEEFKYVTRKTESLNLKKYFINDFSLTFCF